MLTHRIQCIELHVGIIVFYFIQCGLTDTEGFGEGSLASTITAVADVLSQFCGEMCVFHSDSLIYIRIKL